MYFQEDVHEDMLCVLLLPTDTAGAKLFKSLNCYMLGDGVGHFVSGYTQSGRHSFLVSLLGSNGLLFSVSMCTM